MHSNSDIVKRTGFGMIYLAVMVGGLMFRFGFLALMMLIMLGCMNEFHFLALGKGSAIPQRLLALFAGALMLTVSFLVCQDLAGSAWLAAALLPIILIPLSFIVTGRIEDMEKLYPVYASLVYIALPVSLSPFIVFNDGVYSEKLILSLFILIWMSDSGAYCFGSTLGQREGAAKMSPKISPKKSWWGFWGCLFTGALSGFVLHCLRMLEIPTVHCVVVGIIVAVSCVCGDLVESMWKRRFGVKDSGNVIPGHGGFLDRFDSSLVSIPLASLYLLIFNLI